MKRKGILLILITMIFLSGCSTNNSITKASLIIYGISATPQTYDLEENASIKDLMSIVDKITIKDNFMSQESDFDVSKGESYTLKFIGDQPIEYQFIYNYLIYNHNVYSVSDYQTVVKTLKEIFKI